MSLFFVNTINASRVSDYLSQLGAPSNAIVYINLLLLLTITSFLIILTDYLAKRILVGAIQKFSKRTTSRLDDYLIKNKVVVHLAKVIPVLILAQAVPFIFADFEGWVAPVTKALDIYLVLLSIWIIRSILRTAKDFFKTINAFKDKPVESFIQVFTIFLYLVGGLLIFSLLTGKPFWAFVTAMGAASAILLLVFKDTIMGFVASIQVSTNDMVRIGDWITMEKYGADGDVIEINLTTVKVQNFDKTITTIPTYYLISDSFKNWRGMQRTGGRRIKRSIYIKISSIRYLSDADIARLGKVQSVAGYLKERSTQIARYNQENGIDKSVLINGRSMTNVGVFRQYIDAYIRQHPYTHKGMSMMVRQLEPTTSGMPLELYLFANSVVWLEYESIMADIFDHVLAAVKYFDLEVFEMPAADDVRRMSTAHDSLSVKGLGKQSLMASTEPVDGFVFA